MIVMPVLILCLAGMSWWWGASEASHTRLLVDLAVTGLVEDAVHETSTSVTDMRLRWADASLRHVFRSGVSQFVQEAPWTVHVSDDVREGMVPVTVVGEHGSILLTVHPIAESGTAVIRSVELTPRPTAG